MTERKSDMKIRNCVDAHIVSANNTKPNIN